MIKTIKGEREKVMTIAELQKQILRLKAEKDFYILAHSYVAREICEIADSVGDSYKLSCDAQKAKNANILLCGVRFMAETAKILSPEKHVYLSCAEAGCPMAEQMDKDMIEAIKETDPTLAVVAYVNTTAELKTVADVCVTSSSAVQIVRNMEEDNILFIPDCNLGAYVKEQVPEKKIELLQGGCPVHAAISKKDVLAVKAKHPSALFAVHPECRAEVVALADYVGSTSGIMQFAKKSDAKEFIIGTEISIAETLQYECPDKKFYPLSKRLICPNMKATTLADVYHVLNGEGGEEILLDDETIAKAKRCLDRMIALGG